MSVASRRLLLTLALAVGASALACSGGTAPPASDGTATVAGVSLEPPEGWQAVASDEQAGVVASERWEPPDATTTGLQVVVGCDQTGGGVDDLVEGVLTLPRGALIVTEATEFDDVTTPIGFDAARRLELTFGAGREDDARTLRTGALYGHAGPVLVLVELSAPVASYDPGLAATVLDSVRADRDALEGACPPSQQP